MADKADRWSAWQAYARWLDPELIEAIDGRRRARGEVQRDRKLGTLTMLWLMLGVALHNREGSLRAIVQEAAAELADGSWTISASAFCQARARFSPRPVAAAVGVARAAAPDQRPGHGEHVVRLAAGRH